MHTPTPALLVDLDQFDANVLAARQMLAGTGKFLRPHFKTHRAPGLALRQAGPEVIGFTCATVGEVDALAAAGLSGLLLANEVVSPGKIETLARLAQKTEIIVAVDDLQPLCLFEDACRRAGSTIGVLIDVDTGLNRCGVRSLEAALPLAEAVAGSQALRLRGLMGYEGRLRHSDPGRAEAVQRAYDRLGEFKAHLESAGYPIEIVSGAGTATLPDALAHPTITEIQAGTYCLNEPELDGTGLPFAGAAWVLGAVISCTHGRVVLDAGRRSVTSDHGLPVCSDPRGRLVGLNDEHAILEWDGPLPELGEVIRLRPTQNRTTFNLHDAIWLERGGQVIGVLPVSARGKS